MLPDGRAVGLTKGPDTMGVKGAAFDERRLARLGEAMQRHVDEGGVPGIVAGLCRDGETHVVAAGCRSRDDESLRPDANSRTASVTGPMIVVAMTPAEACWLRLGGSVDPLPPAPAGRLVPRTRAGVPFWTLAYQSLGG